MSDKFHLTMRMSRDSDKRPDWKAFKRLFRSSNSSDERDGFFSTEDATGDTVDRLHGLAEHGFSFYGHHGAATDFDAGAFYAVSNQFVGWDAADDGCPVIRVVVEGPHGAKMIEPEKALSFANQLARVTVLIDHGWKPNQPPKKVSLKVV